MKAIRRLSADAPVDAYRKAQRGSLRRMPLSEAEFRVLERERPECIVVEGDAVLVAEPRTDRIDLHYAFPDQAPFSKQFAPMLGRLAPRFTISDAPFGINLRLGDIKLRPAVEPALFAQAFEVTREWIRMELEQLPTAHTAAFPEGFALRAATTSDVEAIVQLIYDSFEDPTVSPRGWAEAVVDNARLVRLLEGGSSRAAGLVHLRPEDATTGYVSELAVHPDFQRRGLGEALMRWSLSWFRQQGLRRAALTTSPDNERAIALYRKLGFTVTEQGVDYRRSLDEDEVPQTLEKHNLAQRTNS